MRSRFPLYLVKIISVSLSNFSTGRKRSFVNEKYNFHTCLVELVRNRELIKINTNTVSLLGSAFDHLLFPSPDQLAIVLSKFQFNRIILFTQIH